MSGPENKSIISRFILCPVFSYIRVFLFCLGNTGSNLGPEKISYTRVSFISGLHCTRVRMDQGVMAIKVYTTFSGALGLVPGHQMKFRPLSRTLGDGGFYFSAEMQPASSIPPVDWANRTRPIRSSSLRYIR